MAPIQILTNNMLYDFSQVPIPTDAVDEELVARPRPWDVGEIKRFILCIGPISSIFDYTTFFVMLYLFKCWDPSRAPLFQTGWFVESIMTQTLIIHIIRTNKIPFFQSRASWSLTLTTMAIMAFGAWLPYSPLASSLGLVHLPGLYWPILLATLLAYSCLTQGIKGLAAAEEMDMNGHPLFLIPTGCNQELLHLRRSRKRSLCSELRSSGICKFLKQVFPAGENRYGKIDCPYGWITAADGKDGYAVTVHKWI